MMDQKRVIQHRLRVLDHAAQSGDVSFTCRYYGIARATFYRWRAALKEGGNDGLADKRPGPRNHPHQTPSPVVEKVLYLRRNYHLGPIRIVWYLARYHDIKISDAGVYRIYAGTSEVMKLIIGCDVFSPEYCSTLA